MSTAAAPTVHPVDDRLPPPRLEALGLQRVPVVYAGAVAVPQIIGRALKLGPEQVTMAGHARGHAGRSALSGRPVRTASPWVTVDARAHDGPSTAAELPAPVRRHMARTRPQPG